MDRFEQKDSEHIQIDVTRRIEVRPDEYSDLDDYEYLQSLYEGGIIRSSLEAAEKH